MRARLRVENFEVKDLLKDLDIDARILLTFKVRTFKCQSASSGRTFLGI